jgi:hypothetical protein
MINYVFRDEMADRNQPNRRRNLVNLWRECGGDGVTIGKKA